MNSGYLAEYLSRVPHVMAALVAAIVVVTVLWLIRNRLTPHDDHHAIRSGNSAIAIERTGYIVGVTIALAMAMVGYNSALADAPLTLGLKYLLIAVLFFGLTYVVDWAVLPKVKNDTLLAQGNAAVAVAMAMVYLALGIVIGAASIGGASSLVQSLSAMAAFALLGIGVVIAVTFIHRAVRHRDYDLHEQLVQGEMVPALELGSLVLSIGIVSSIGLIGDLTTWWDGLKAFTATTAVGLVLFYASVWLVHRLTTVGESAGAVYRRSDLPLMSLIAAGRVCLAILLWATFRCVM